MPKHEGPPLVDPWEYELCTTASFQQICASSLPIDSDAVIVHNLSLEVNTNDAWGRYRPQPVLLSVACRLRTSFGEAAGEDQVTSSTIHYGKLAKALRASFSDIKVERGGVDLIRTAWTTVLQMARSEDLGTVEIAVRLPKALRFGKTFVLEATICLPARKRTCVHRYEGLRYSTIIGVNDNEKERAQSIEICAKIDGSLSDALDHPFEDRLAEQIEGSSFETLEALAYSIDLARFGRKDWCRDATVTLRIEKPSAIPLAEAAAVEITRRIRGGPL